MPPATGGMELDCDEHLLQKLNHQDNGALIVLFRRYSRVIHRFSSRILRDEGEADDLLQDFFLFLFKNALVFDPEKGNARSWIIAMAYQHALQRRRYLKRRNFYCAQSLDPDRQPSRHLESEDALLQRIDGRELLRKYRSSLSEDQQQVLNLHFFEGRDFREIADLTGQALPTVRSHYYRALKKLRTEIATRETQKS